MVAQLIILYLQTSINPRFFFPRKLLGLIVAQQQVSDARMFYKTKEEIEKENLGIMEVYINN